MLTNVLGARELWELVLNRGEEFLFMFYDM